jgi:hypothetical protein
MRCPGSVKTETSFKFEVSSFKSLNFTLQTRLPQATKLLAVSTAEAASGA